MPKRQHKECYEVSKAEVAYMKANGRNRRAHETQQHQRNNNNNINHCHTKTDHFPLESDHITKSAFNCFYDGESVACDDDAAAVISVDNCENNNSNCVKSINGGKDEARLIEHAYENLRFDLHLQGKKLLLHKYFRSTEQNYAEYENLCRGCGYGVFEARGSLCNFCACIVNGVNGAERCRGEPEVVVKEAVKTDASTNIYENICGECAAIYSGNECKCANDGEINAESEKKVLHANEAAEWQKLNEPKTKLGKSKSFNKSDKRRGGGIFRGFIGSLKRVASVAHHSDLQSPRSACRKLQIVHNVDGFDNVYRTQETFDLQRICELKRCKNSSSDQHIYGRVRLTKSNAEQQQAQRVTQSQTLPKHFSKSHDQLLLEAESQCTLNSSTQSDFRPIANTHLDSVTKSVSADGNRRGKRPRISKPRFLHISRALKQNGSNSSAAGNTEQNLPPHFNDSIARWMTSLRWEVHNYRSYGSFVDDVDFVLCNTKSVPGKNNFIYYGAGSNKVENLNDIYAVPVKKTTSSAANVVSNCANIDRSTPECESANNSDSDGSIECVTLRRTNKNKNEKQQNQKEQIESHHTGAHKLNPPVAQIVNEFKLNLLAKQMHPHPHQQKQKQQQSSTQPPVAVAAPFDAVLSASDQRAKRQGIYLRVDSDSALHGSGHITKSSVDDCEHERTHTNTNSFDYLRNKQTNNATEQYGDLLFQADLQFSRTAAEQASKRCGIHERNSEFVSDILQAFDTFLQSAKSETETAKTEIQLSEIKLNETSKKLQTQQSKANDVEIGAQTLAQSDDPYTNTNTSSGVHAATCSCLNSINENDLNDSERDKQLTASFIQNCCCCTTQIAPLRHALFASSIDISNANEPPPQLHLAQLFQELLLSFSLNRIVICYDKSLSVYLNAIRAPPYCRKYYRCSSAYFISKYHRFYAFLVKQNESMKLSLPQKSSDETAEKPLVKLREKKGNGSVAEKRNSVKIIVQLLEQNAENEEKVKENVRNSADFESIAEENVRRHVESFEKVTRSVSKEESTQLETKNSSVNPIDPPIVPKNSESDQTQPKSSSVFETQSSGNQTVTPIKLKSASPKTTQRPQVPARDPKTFLTITTDKSMKTNTSTNIQTPHNKTPPVPAKRESLATKSQSNQSMTVPKADSKTAPVEECNKSHNNNNNNNNINRERPRPYTCQKSDEDDIYQPIWKFKTATEKPVPNKNEVEQSGSVAAARALIGNAADDSCSLGPSPNDADDLGEWETDDEFMFTTQLSTDRYSTTRSNNSTSGSTATNFNSSTATLASGVSVSLTHHLFRNLAIFFSLTEPKLRAIVYDYDRVYASTYFSRQPSINSSIGSCGSGGGDSGIGKSPPPRLEHSPMLPPRGTSAVRVPTVTVTTLGESVGGVGNKTAKATSATKLATLPDSVFAWKFMLLDVNYLEDEEDMIVSESEILRAQQIKEDFEIRQSPQLHILQRFKSASINNLDDLPIEDDKKSIAERMRNKLQRGVFKLNVRSPKGEKKSRNIFRRAEATSLYLEDGMKPKYPIFAAPLEQLELNVTTQPHVPRFVVDCVEYIERKDCIRQDGLYRASGNKVAIDELKQKLSESYIYDPKLLNTDDIHTLTSLLKLFFRELGAPLIPQETYLRLGRNLTDAAAMETMRLAFDQMREPNRSTLKFLIRHLTHVAAYSSDNRMPASNLAIVWGPCLLSANQIEFDIGRMNTLAKVLIENFEHIFMERERLVA